MNNKAVMIGLAVLAFLVAAVLVLTIVRMLFGGRLRMPGGRARQARLGIVDAFDLDRQRQLIIVRRDNTEHLIMIGGPNDVLIESEIVRVEALRDGRRDKVGEAVPAPGPVEARIPAPPSLERDAPPFAAGSFAPQQARQEQMRDGQVREGVGRDAPIRDVPIRDAPVRDPNARETYGEAPPLSPSMPDFAVPADEPVAAPRAPTFPLPPRRPASPAPSRPAPSLRLPDGPLRLPEGVSRTDDIPPPPVPNAGAAPLPPLVATPQVNPVDGTPPGVPTLGAPTLNVPIPVGPASGAPSRPAPAFLKPRPPIRPLLRTTPQPVRPLPGGVPPVADPQVGGPQSDPTQTAAPPPRVTPAQPTPQPAPLARASAPPPPAPVAAPQPAPVESKDALESLEEEMAKLLGRGPGA